MINLAQLKKDFNPIFPKINELTCADEETILVLVVVDKC
jgi:hypothetical protein